MEVTIIQKINKARKTLLACNHKNGSISLERKLLGLFTSYICFEILLI